MKKIINLLLLLITITFLSSCFRAKPDADEEAVLVKKPMFFGHGGVSEDAISAGATWCVFTTDCYYFKIVPLTMIEHFENLIPADNTPISFSAYLKLQIIKGKSPILYEKFGKDWYINSIQPTFRTIVRDKSCVYKMFDLASKREISAKVENELFIYMSDYVKKLNIPVQILQVSIGAITPPEQVLDETKNTAAQNQSILTQTARANAELARKQAEVNKALADKAYQSQMNMSIDQYLHLRQLEIEKEKVDLIKDNKNVSIIFGGLPVTYPLK